MRESQQYWCRYTLRALREMKQRLPCKLCCFSAHMCLTLATWMLRRSFAVKVYGFDRTQAAKKIAPVTGARQLKSRPLTFQMCQMYHLHIRAVPEGLQGQHKF